MYVQWCQHQNLTSATVTKILMEFFSPREQAIPIDVATIKFQACHLSSMFCAKNESAQISSIRRFIARNGNVYCFGTHISQWDPKEKCRGWRFHKDSLHSLRLSRLRQEVHDYHYTLKCLLLLLSNYCIFCFIHHRWILNIDQTPVYFSMHPRKTLARKGNITIHVWSSTDDTKRATDAVTITASWNKLPLMMIFKGTECGCIAKRRIAHNHKGPIHVCQENAWMDCNAMLRWVDLLLKPWFSLLSHAAWCDW